MLSEYSGDVTVKMRCLQKAIATRYSGMFREAV